MPKNIFVVGMDEANREYLGELEEIEGWRFHSALDFDEALGENPLSIKDCINAVDKRIASFPGKVDALVGFWDFPITVLVPYICQRHGLPGPPLMSVLKCEHKYWSRLEQSRVIDQYPRFNKVDPFADDPLSQVDIEFPFWLKPVKSTASQLGFRINNREDFEEAVRQTRKEIHRFADPFNHFLEEIDLPGEMKDVNGGHCLAEDIVEGLQFTVSGFCHNGKAEVYGLIESLNYPDSSSFLCYEYPSRLPDEVQDRARDSARRIMEYIGYDMAPFNIEYFWNEEKDQLWTLEINPRISQSHADIYEKVDGRPNEKLMVDLALGHYPDFPRRQGEFNVAGKFFYRRFEDGHVDRIPTAEEIEEIEADIPGSLIEVNPSEGMRLSDLRFQDSYSYDLAHIHLGASDHEELFRLYDEVTKRLQFRFSD